MSNIIKALLELQVAVPSEMMQTTVIDVVKQSENFKTLEKAIREAGLADVLTGRGPFTVFAPNDDAFKRIPQDTLNSILKDKSRLARILKYHVVRGRYTSNDLSAEESLKTLEGSVIPINMTGYNRIIGSAKAIQPDIKASNGIIHVIDSVLLPE
ncbi:Nex18 symbiotically induced protein [Methanocella sp. CWC-04]|uniref:Nex18 symbiotically induced protein n=1 Tax=Methanooceanicella nereidis TaxID=2052831 RepID=A0AAP2RBQ1_9EURY|nr:fasciclin domain-containing protein [Methanocella sp. CWC-04]MCD1294127.1 Nex18 symbiotically induced protein [Methanocella sp. CWC-04]